MAAKKYKRRKYKSNSHEKAQKAQKAQKISFLTKTAFTEKKSIWSFI